MVNLAEESLGTLERAAPPASKERLAKLAHEIEARRKIMGMDFYVPNRMQWDAHRSDARTILVCAPNRTGKSTYGMMELSFHLTRRYPDWYPTSRRFDRPIRAVISATSFAIVSRVIEPKMRELLPQGYYKVKRTPQGYLSKIVCKDDSTVDVLTLEMADLMYEGANWDFAWEDEPQHQRKREGIVRGLLDSNGLEVITFTPISEPWMKEELIDKVDGKKIAMFGCDIRDNKFDIEGNPILSEEGIQRFEDSLSEEFRDARLKGIFYTVRGRVYKEYGDEHLVQCDHQSVKADECPYHYRHPDPVICILDPHDRQPHHVIWAYIDSSDDIFVDFEMSVHCELDDLAAKIKFVEKKLQYNMRKRLIDPNFGRKPARAGSNASVKQELSRFGVGFYEPCDDVELGHMIVRDYLHYNHTKPVTAINKPKLYFAKDRVPLTIKSMRNLQFQEWQGKTRGEKDPKEVEKDKENHGADCVRYLCITKPKWNYANKEGYELEEAPY